MIYMNRPLRVRPIPPSRLDTQRKDPQGQLSKYFLHGSLHHQCLSMGERDATSALGNLSMINL